MSDGLPPIDQSLIPAGVRAEGQKAVALYESALTFEGMLDRQLAQSLTETLQPSGTGGQPVDAATSLTLQMLPEALSKQLVGSGGLGLAPQLYEALGGKTASPTVEAAKK